MPTVTVKWGGREISVELDEAQTVSDLKQKLQEATLVNPKRQKLLGLKKKDGKAPAEEDVMGDLKLAPGVKYMMMG